ncbi:MAG: glycine zipper domain-containing protein [Asticcacaulis sp.]
MDHRDRESVVAFNRLRRRFLQGAGAGGGALLVPGLARAAATKAPAQTQPLTQAAVVQGAVARMTFVSPSEADLNAIAAIDPTLHAIASDIVSHAKYTFTAVASGVAGADSNELAAPIRAYIATRKPASRASYMARSAAMLAAPVAAREATFGRYAALTPAAFLASDRSRLKLTTIKPLATVKKPDILASLFKLSNLPQWGDDAPDPDEDAKEQQAEKDAAAKAAHDKDVALGQKFKELEFYISSVKCIDNTGGALEGTDEIAMGGCGVGATGHIHKIPQFHVMDGFDVGVEKTYPGGRQFCKYEIPMAKPWPHEFIATVALAELDSGGFGDFLQDVWDKVKSLVTGAIADVVGDLVGAAIGSVIPGLGTLIGAAVGAFIGWLVGLFHNDDDVVGSKTRKLTLWHTVRSYYDKYHLATPTGIPVTMDLKDSGHYRV